MDIDECGQLSMLVEALKNLHETVLGMHHYSYFTPVKQRGIFVNVVNFYRPVAKDPSFLPSKLSSRHVSRNLRNLINPFDKLPNEIIVLIIGYLSFQSIFKLACVNRQFSSILSGESSSGLWKKFAKKKFNSCLGIDLKTAQDLCQEIDYRSLLLNSGILEIESVYEAINNNYDKRHIVYSFYIHGSSVPKRVLIHQECNYDCLADYKTIVGITHEINSDNPKDLILSPFVPHNLDISLISINLPIVFPKYIKFLKEFKYWDRFINPLLWKNVQELHRKTECFIKKYKKQQNMIVTDDILIGLHLILLQNTIFIEKSLKNFGFIPDIDFGELLGKVNSSEDIWKNNYVNKTESNIPFVNSTDANIEKCIFYSYALLENIQMMAKKLNKFNNVNLLSKYMKYLKSTDGRKTLQSSQITVSEKPIIYNMLHLHLLHPVKFRNDCFYHLKSIPSYWPTLEVSKYIVMYIHDVNGNVLALTDNGYENGDIVLTPVEGTFSKKQKWELRDIPGPTRIKSCIRDMFLTRLYKPIKKSIVQTLRYYIPQNINFPCTVVLKKDLKEDSEYLQFWKVDYRKDGLSPALKKEQTVENCKELYMSVTELGCSLKLKDGTSNFIWSYAKVL